MLNSRAEQYGYDELSRLTSVNYGDGETQGYTFEPMGNRLGKTDNSTGTEGTSYNAANVLLSRTIGGTENDYTNDADGNTLTGGGRANAWDSQNRLVSCATNGNTCSCGYGSDGLRRRSTVNGTTTDFVLAPACAGVTSGGAGDADRRGNGGTVRHVSGGADGADVPAGRHDWECPGVHL